MLNELLKVWSSEKVTSLAPDKASLTAARKLSAPQKWAALGHDTCTVWGEYQGSGGSPYHVKLDLLKFLKGEVAVGCSCPSRKHPCKHVLSLFFILVEHTDAITQQSAPDYVQAWLDKQAIRARKQKREDAKSVDPAQAAKTIKERKAKIAAGLQEFELWLENIVRHGLGDPQIKSYAFWDAKAARMIDAQAPGVANLLQKMSGIPAKGSDWVEPLLTELGKLYLIVESFKRFDQLPPGCQYDLRTILGWHVKREELAIEEGLSDEWVVIGHHLDKVDERLRRQRLWLRGQFTGRDALILEFAFGDAPFDTYLQTGFSIEAELAFYPSQYPLRAFILHQSNEPKPAQPLVGTTIQHTIQQYAAALAKNPWLIQFPALLQAVIPTRYSGQWVICEDNGHYMPIADTFQHKWSLMAIGGGHPVQLAGEWDGRAFLPTGAVLSDRFVDFSQVGKF